jgi:ABC-type Fe3+ transport system substrate-binding protein
MISKPRMSALAKAPHPHAAILFLDRNIGH